MASKIFWRPLSVAIRQILLIFHCSIVARCLHAHKYACARTHTHSPHVTWQPASTTCPRASLSFSQELPVNLPKHFAMREQGLEVPCSLCHHLPLSHSSPPSQCSSRSQVDDEAAEWGYAVECDRALWPWKSESIIIITTTTTAAAALAWALDDLGPTLIFPLHSSRYATLQCVSSYATSFTPASPSSQILFVFSAMPKTLSLLPSITPRCDWFNCCYLQLITSVFLGLHFLQGADKALGKARSAIPW